jgi:hypothetical protein
MKRWVAAILSVLFLSTATLHVFAHVGNTDAGCGVCHVQQAGVVVAPAPSVVVVAAPGEVLAPLPVPRRVAAAVAAGSARAPPAVPA